MHHAPRSGVLGHADMPAYLRVLRPWLAAHAACHPPWPLSVQAPSLVPEPGDEEAGRRMTVRGREQELRPLRMRVPGPFVAERLRLETRRVHDGFVLVRVERADP